MSTLLLSVAALAVLAGICIGATLAIAGHQSEESPAARRAALARVSARACAQPQPRGVWLWRLAIHRDLPARFSEREGHRRVVRIGRWALRWRTHGETLQVPSVLIPSPEPPRLTPSKSIEPSGRRHVVEQLGDVELAPWSRIPGLKQSANYSLLVADGLAEQELARRRAQSGGEAA